MARRRRTLKLPFGIRLNNVLEIALAIGLVAAGGFAVYYLGQRFFSFFSYQDMTREQVLETYKQVDKRLPILSRACKENHNGVSCRGIYLPDSGLMTYYHFDDNGIDKANFSLYYSPNELWTTAKPLIPGLGGKVVQVG